MYVDSCICERTAAIGIHRLGGDVVCEAGRTVEDDGIRRGEIPRSIECNPSHSSNRNVIHTLHRMAGSLGSGEVNTMVACQGRDAASRLGMNRRNAMLATCAHKDQSYETSQGQERTKESFHGAVLI